ncbi:MAG: aminotransferase class IV, partial [Aquificaceae bacterium]|nr:aminotransferase class IV [Aquificaceae bacterium]
MQSRTLLFGQGLFETILCIPSELKLILHYQRLSSSARALGIPCPSYEEFEKSVLTSCSKNRGLKLVLEVLGSSRPSAKELSSRLLRFEFDHDRISTSMRLCTLEYRRHSLDPTSRHKTTNYLFNLILKEHANKLGFDDCII